MGRNIKPINLHQGGDLMPSGRKGIAKFYEELISRCKRNKNRTTIYRNVIDEKFIEVLKFRLNELKAQML
tara:strand:- start:19892 stop:20101 length:210 start_codon:yes stop_codon:yes gene_type:complete